jgi:hypothetical protein
MRRPFVGITNEYDATLAAAEHPAAKARKYARLAAANKRAAKALAAANAALIKAQVLEDELDPPANPAVIMRRAPRN